MEKTLEMFASESSGDRLGRLVSQFLDWCERHRAPATVETYRRDLGFWLRWLRIEAIPLLPEAITRAVMVRYTDSLGALKWATVQRRTACVASLYRWLADRDLGEGEPCRRLPMPKRERNLPRFPTTAEVKAIIRATRWPWEKCAILLIATTGLRRAEAVRALLEDLDLEAGSLRVRGKGAKERAVPIEDLARDAIGLYLAFRRPRLGSDRLLVDERGNDLTTNTLHKRFKRLVSGAGVRSELSLHWLRHYAATTAHQEGADIRTVQALLGHESLTTTARYLHSDDEHRRAAVRAVSALLTEP